MKRLFNGLLVAASGLLVFTSCKNEENPSTSNPTEFVESHTHTFADTYSHDDNKHWKDSTCGHDEKEALADHDFGAWTTVKEPTYFEDGLKKKTCNTCGFEVTEVLPVTHEHTEGICECGSLYLKTDKLNLITDKLSQPFSITLDLHDERFNNKDNAHSNGTLKSDDATLAYDYEVYYNETVEIHAFNYKESIRLDLKDVTLREFYAYDENREPQLVATEYTVSYISIFKDEDGVLNIGRKMVDIDFKQVEEIVEESINTFEEFLNSIIDSVDNPLVGIFVEILEVLSTSPEFEGLVDAILDTKTVNDLLESVATYLNLLSLNTDDLYKIEMLEGAVLITPKYNNVNDIVKDLIGIDLLNSSVKDVIEPIYNLLDANKDLLGATLKDLYNKAVENGSLDSIVSSFVSTFKAVVNKIAEKNDLIDPEGDEYDNLQWEEYDLAEELYFTTHYILNLNNGSHNDFNCYHGDECPMIDCVVKKENGDQTLYKLTDNLLKAYMAACVTVVKGQEDVGIYNTWNTPLIPDFNALMLMIRGLLATTDENGNPVNILAILDYIPVEKLPAQIQMVIALLDKMLNTDEVADEGHEIVLSDLITKLLSVELKDTLSSYLENFYEMFNSMVSANENGDVIINVNNGLYKVTISSYNSERVPFEYNPPVQE